MVPMLFVEASYNMLYCLAAGAQSIAYYAGESSAFAFAAAQADSISTCLLKASSSVNPSVQVSSCMYEAALGLQQKAAYTGHPRHQAVHCPRVRLPDAA